MTAFVAALHVFVYGSAGLVARTLLAGRTLAGQHQTEEHWALLLREVVLRSGVVACLSLGTAFALVSVRATREQLVAFFTAKQGPLALGVFRFVCFATFFIVWSPAETLFFARLPTDLVVGLPDPLPLWRLVVPLAPLAPLLVRVLEISCFLAAIGLFTRVASFGVVISGFFLLGLPQVYGKVDHYHHMLWFSLILATSPAGDAFSVDALLRAALRSPARAPAPAPEPRLAYALPLRFIWILFGVIYYWAGFWKLVQHGTAWIFSDNFQNHLYLKWFEEETFRPLFRIDRYPWLCHAGAAFGAAFELSFIFLVPFKKTRPWAIALGLFFHNATFLLFNIAFLSLQLYYLSYVDWDALLARLSREGALHRRLASIRERVVAALRRAAATAWGARVMALATRAPSDRAAIRGVLGTSLVIITVGMGYGAVHLCDAWPFACYPTFSSLIRRETSSLVVRVESGDPGADVTSGEARRQSFREAFRSERYAALVRAILLERDPATRARKMGALAKVVRSLDPSIRAGDTIVIVEALFSTDPDVERAPLREDRLYAFRIGDGSVVD